MSQVRERVAFLKKGCGCRTGCSTARCKCKKNNHQCGPGCKCVGCTNVSIDTSSNTHLTDDSPSESESSSGDDGLEEEVDTLMTDIFGISDFEDEDI